MSRTLSSLQSSIEASPAGLTLTELLVQHPGLPRRTAQRWISELVATGNLTTQGKARSRRYFAAPKAQAVTTQNVTRLAHTAPALRLYPSVPVKPTLEVLETSPIPLYIPLSADSRDIIAYIGQPLKARRPVGYQRDFLDSYQPNVTFYLSASMRSQLHNIGQTEQAHAPAGTYSRAILNRLLIDLSWASSNLEGNTYSRLDTRDLIEQGQAARGKAAVETQMILNHKSAIELLVENIATAEFNRYTLMNLHSTLAENLLPNPADEGRVRQHEVDIGLSVYRPLSIPAQLDAMLDKFLFKANMITEPFEQSFFAMVHLPYLQPFADINKRTSRLAANLPLFRANLCPLTFLDVPEPAYSRAILGVYEMTRVELLRDLYLWAYERSTQEYLAIKQELAEPDPHRLAWRDMIKQTIHDVVTQPQMDAFTLIQQTVKAHVPITTQATVQALIVEELRRLHEGVIARYGLRPSELAAWKAVQGMGMEG